MFGKRERKQEEPGNERRVFTRESTRGKSNKNMTFWVRILGGAKKQLMTQVKSQEDRKRAGYHNTGAIPSHRTCYIRNVGSCREGGQYRFERRPKENRGVPGITHKSRMGTELKKADQGFACIGKKNQRKKKSER